MHATYSILYVSTFIMSKEYKRFEASGTRRTTSEGNGSSFSVDIRSNGQRKCCPKVMFNSLRENLYINQSRSDFELYISLLNLLIYLFIYFPYMQLKKHINIKNHEESKARL